MMDSLSCPQNPGAAEKSLRIVDSGHLGPDALGSVCLGQVCVYAGSPVWKRETWKNLQTVAQGVLHGLPWGLYCLLLLMEHGWEFSASDNFAQNGYYDFPQAVCSFLQAACDFPMAACDFQQAVCNFPQAAYYSSQKFVAYGGFPEHEGNSYLQVGV